MKRSALLPLAALLFVACADPIQGPEGPGAPKPSFSSVHFKGGANAGPIFTDGGLYLSASGTLSGLGEGDIVVHLIADGQAYSLCINPSGATQPPGQNPADITTAGGQPIPEDEFKNGNVSFNVSTAAPASPMAGAPGCPNKRWTQPILDVAFTSATIVVVQGGVEVLRETFSL
jgi:hypothetical protein